MKTSRIVAVAAAALLLGASGNAFAQSNWDKEHPRRAEVNQRLENQNKRIRQEVKEGDMTKAEARNLHRDDRAIRKEERMMARQNGGGITRQEQRTLNQQENAVSREIGK